jgi:hypothetical protein
VFCPCGGQPPVEGKHLLDRGKRKLITD